MIVNVALSQFHPTLNVKDNLHKMLEMLTQVNENDILVMPEACLSGYSHDLNFLTKETAINVEKAILELEKATKKYRVHLIFGTLKKQQRGWYNTGIYLSPYGTKEIYQKVNLAIHERNVLQAGNKLPVFRIKIDGVEVKIAIQLCREIRFPEQWKFLSMGGSEIIFYLTNVIGTEKLQVWNAHLISRAAENQRFIVSSNITHTKQGCSSMIVSPQGEILRTLLSSDETVERIQLNLEKNTNWYLSQSRLDLVRER